MRRVAARAAAIARRAGGALYVRRWTVARVLVLVLVVEGAVRVVTGPLVHRVQPGFVGVRHTPWGAGVMRRDHEPGLHWTLPGVLDWHELDAGTLEAEFGTRSPALEVRTQEGNAIGLAVSVPYRLIEGRAHRVVAESLRAGHAELVRATLETVLLSELGRASSEDWLDPASRESVLAGAEEAATRALEPLHVRPEGVLLQALRFPPPYESKLREIQRGGQQRRLSEASAAQKQVQLAVERGEQENARAVQERSDELSRALTELRVTRQRELRRIRGEAEARAQEIRLAAERALAEAIDAATRLRIAAEDQGRAAIDEALAGEEGRLWLAVEGARSLRLAEIAVDANDPRLPNLLDLEAVTELFLPAKE